MNYRILTLLAVVALLVGLMSGCSQDNSSETRAVPGETRQPAPNPNPNANKGVPPTVQKDMSQLAPGAGAPAAGAPAAPAAGK